MENDQTLDRFIEGLKDSQQKVFLMQFKQKFSNTDRYNVTERDESFEIMVSHKSSNGFTGGTEAYRVDKQSGEVRMLWHEHPMRMPKEEKLQKINP